MRNDVTRERLHELAAREPDGHLLSLFVDLDPTRFASPPSRATEVTSLLDRAARLLGEHEDLTHDERRDLRAAVDGLRDALDPDRLPADGARGLAVFAAPAREPEILRLPTPVATDVAVARVPRLLPLMGVAPVARWAVALTQRGDTRLLLGDEHALEEETTLADRVHPDSQPGGWSQRRHEETVADETRRHHDRVAEALARWHDDGRFDRLAVAGPRGVLDGLLDRLPDRVKDGVAHLEGLDLSAATVEDVRRALEGRATALRTARIAERLERLATAQGQGGDRAAIGAEAVLRALVEQRVELLVLREGVAFEGVRCPGCGWLGLDASSCPADGTPTERHAALADLAAARALDQQAEVELVHRDIAEGTPALQQGDGVAALLRF